VNPDVFPLAGLRLRTPRLELRLPNEAEAVALARSAPDDLETDPNWPVPSGAGPPVAIGVLQWYWRALGTWKADHWRLPLGVWLGGEAVGFQELEAERFSVFRTVETSSWLVAEARGQGIGKEMRGAVLALAFDHLAADLAASGAWESNAASLGVSRALGYEENGWHLHEHAGRVGVMRRVVLTRERWDASGSPVSVENVDPCRPWFNAGGPPSA
jgi:RimJ/RimL family protein N-acetyltransferase